MLGIPIVLIDETALLHMAQQTTRRTQQRTTPAIRIVVVVGGGGGGVVVVVVVCVVVAYCELRQAIETPVKKPPRSGYGWPTCLLAVVTRRGEAVILVVPK